MRQKILFLWLLLLMGSAGARAAEAYTYFNPNDGTLNFCYDSYWSTWKNKGYTTYGMNTTTGFPAWIDLGSQVRKSFSHPDLPITVHPLAMAGQTICPTSPRSQASTT